MKDENGGDVGLREYVERVFSERATAMNASIEANQRAIDLVEKNLDRRIGGLEFRHGSLESRFAWLIGVGSVLIVLAGFVGFVMGYVVNPR